MKYRKLQIAWSVGWGILCLLLVVLWVRSYYYFDAFETNTTWRQLQIRTLPGRLEFHQLDVRRMFRSNTVSLQDAQEILKELSQRKWHVSGPIPKIAATRDSNPGLGFRYSWSQHVTILGVPYWSMVLLFAALAAGVWIPYSTRFSLRTLLIAMTLVALGLGLAVYAAR